MVFIDFSSSEPPKINAKTHSKKASQKNVPKIDFGFRFGLPKTSQNRPNIEKNRKKRPSKKSSKIRAMQVGTPNRKASFLGPKTTIQLPFQWLVLLYWLSHGRPNHCFSLQIPQKIIAKSIENPLRITSKPSQDPPRTLPEPSLKNERVEKSIFSIFFRFFDGPGPPKIEPKSEKIAKKR